jgi:hypothetical protein
MVAFTSLAIGTLAYGPNTEAQTVCLASSRSASGAHLPVNNRCNVSTVTSDDQRAMVWVQSIPARSRLARKDDWTNNNLHAPGAERADQADRSND